MIKHKISVKLEIERYPERCNECPMFSQSPYSCHNERGMEGGCELGYMEHSDMRDFSGRQLFNYCKMKKDPRVKQWEEK
ncbi:MAG: hypothetical protein RR365_08865 [Bacteroides sp.]